MNQVELFQCTKPCANCPYRTDAPLKHWHKEEFKKVIASEQSEFGSTFQCHKQNGSACIGWLMKQDERGLPSIALRVTLSKNNITREYMDKLSSPAPLYNNWAQMVFANYPELLKNVSFNHQLNKTKWQQNK